MFLKLARKSLLSRKGSVLLTLLAITVSVTVLLGIEHIRHQAKTSFNNTVSGTDLIVGARTGDINLLLYSVFRLGNATNNIQWSTYQDIAAHPKVAWTIPISLGDSHRGYRVMGTSKGYFEHFRFGQKQALEFSDGGPFDKVLDVVIGAEIAQKLGYKLGDQLVLAHGLAATSFSVHDDKPFNVVGILKRTGTPVDQTLHVSLAGIEAIHLDWQQGVRIPGQAVAISDLDKYDLTPKNITAFMVGLKSKLATFQLQRTINNHPAEPLLAILPGVTLSELWRMMSVMENTLRLISLLVLAAALLGLCAMLLSSIRERQREIAIMRTVGASPLFIFLLIQAEALLITITACLLACLTLTLALVLTSDYLAEQFGLYIETNIFSQDTWLLIGVVLISSAIASLIPAVSAYLRALQKNLMG